jgi:Ca2+-transporting ATPase
VVGFIVDVPDPRLLQRPPRKPGRRIVNPPRRMRAVSGLLAALTALLVLNFGPDEPRTTEARCRR